MARKKAEKKKTSGDSASGKVTPIKNLDGEEQLRARLRDARRRVVTLFMEVAKDLHTVNRDDLWQKWGFKTFGEYCESELDFSRRKAEMLIATYDKFAVRMLKARPDAPEIIEELGWTKAYTVTPIVTDDGKNLDEWVDRAGNCTVRELTGAVKEALPSDDKGKGGDGGEKFQRKAFSLAPAQNENVNAALELAKGIADSNKPGHLLDLICTEFLSTHDAETFVSEQMARLEEQTGLRLVAIDPNKQEIVYGEHHLEDGEADGASEAA